MGDRGSVPFGQLFEAPLRNGLTKPKAVRGHGVKMVNMGEVFANSRIHNLAMDRVPLEPNERNSSLLRSGDLLFARQSLVLSGAGKCCLFQGDAEDVTFESHIIRCRLDPRKADPTFYFYLFQSNQGRALIESIVEQVAAAGIRGSDLARLKVPVPAIAEQMAISAMLGALDDKIESNRRMNVTLEAMARALFQSWFVDFDPVRTKLDGRTPVGLDETTAVLFTNAFQDSELGTIPSGWEVTTAAEISTVGIGKTPPRKEHQWFSRNSSDVPWMSIRDLGDADVFILRTSEFLTSEAVEKFRVRRIPDNTVVLSFKLTMGRVAITDGEMLSNEAIAHFCLNHDASLGSAYLYFYLKGFGYDQLGSTSSIATAINSDMVRGIRVLVPPRGIAEAFERTVGPLFTQVKNLRRQSHTLATLRDTLLPKLLTGELRVAEARELAEAAP